VIRISALILQNVDWWFYTVGKQLNFKVTSLIFLNFALREFWLEQLSLFEVHYLFLVNDVSRCMYYFICFFFFADHLNTEQSPESFQLGALHLCRGAWHSKNWQKLHWFIVFHVSIWGGLGVLFGESKLPPWRQGCLYIKIATATVLNCKNDYTDILSI